MIQNQIDAFLLDDFEQAFQYAALRKIRGHLWQKVIVTDQAGQVFALDYKMVQVDGLWRIAAVQLLPIPDLSA